MTNHHRKISIDSYQVPLPVVLIPAFNESDVIATVIREIHKHGSYPVVVIDDASTDQTAAVAQEAGATVLCLASQLGAWGATQTGLRYARREGFEYAITMDADGQHEPKWFPHLLAPLASGEADVAVGSCTQRGSRLRKIAWSMIRTVSGITMDDITSGFRAYNTPAIDVLSGRRATIFEYQDVGVLMLLSSNGIHVEDIPISMKPRQNGKSRIFHSWPTVIYYMLHTLLLGFSKRPPPWKERASVRTDYDL